MAPRRPFDTVFYHRLAAAQWSIRQRADGWSTALPTLAHLAISFAVMVRVPLPISLPSPLPLARSPSQSSLNVLTILTDYSVVVEASTCAMRCRLSWPCLPLLPCMLSLSLEMVVVPAPRHQRLTHLHCLFCAANYEIGTRDAVLARVHCARKCAELRMCCWSAARVPLLAHQTQPLGRIANASTH